MTTFLRLLTEDDKAGAMVESCARVRHGMHEPRCFEVMPEAFEAVPGRPFAYWVSNAVRDTFRRLPSFESSGRAVRQGLATADDFRFLRTWWEVDSSVASRRWFPFAKGGAYSPYHSDPPLVLNWLSDGQELKAWASPLYGNSGWSRIIKSTEFYLRPGLTWPARTQQFGVRVLPAGCIFGHKGPMAFDTHDDPSYLLPMLALMASRAFGALVELHLNAADATARSFEVGIIQKSPFPNLDSDQRKQLEVKAKCAWLQKRKLDTIIETSRVFLLPALLRARRDDYDPAAIESELARIQAEINEVAFRLYSFSEGDRAAALGGDGPGATADEEERDHDEEDATNDPPSTDALISWAIGVAFGRFDWRLATGERAAPPEPEPFDPLPTKSPGMLPDGDPPFHTLTGILVDDPGHPNDLVRIAERVLDRVHMPVPGDLRRWLQKDFFPFHLQRYSKSRRKAPIYWPLATESGSYTLWLYYPSLTSQTLYMAVNDLVEPKLKQVGDEASQLRARGSGRSRADEKRLEALEALEPELRDLRDQLLAIAPRYRPNHDDGVPITAAPLWPLFRHKPWQKVLKDTWTKLEKGDYDWAHLAMAYWPDRVREKCKTDKSLAIAHGLEELYTEPKTTPRQTRGRK